MIERKYLEVSQEKLNIIKQTYLLFARTMLSAMTGSYLAIPYANVISRNYWYIAVPWILFGMFGLAMVQKIKNINIISLYVFTFIGGVIITPLLSHTLSLQNGSSIIINAFLMTAVLFASLSMFSMTTKTDFRSYTKPIVIAFFVLLRFSLINIIFFQSSFGQIVLQGLIFIVISALTIIDTQKISQGDYTPIEGAIRLFLDFFNMFSIILQFMGYSEKE